MSGGRRKKELQLLRRPKMVAAFAVYHSLIAICRKAGGVGEVILHQDLLRNRKW